MAIRNTEVLESQGICYLFPLFKPTPTISKHVLGMSCWFFLLWIFWLYVYSEYRYEFPVKDAIAFGVTEYVKMSTTI